MTIKEVIITHRVLNTRFTKQPSPCRSTVRVVGWFCQGALGQGARLRPVITTMGSYESCFKPFLSILAGRYLDSTFSNCFSSSLDNVIGVRSLNNVTMFRL